MKKILLFLLLFILPLFAQNYSINPDSTFRATLATVYDGGEPTTFTIEFWGKAEHAALRCFFMQRSTGTPIMFYGGDGVGTNGMRYQGYQNEGTLSHTSIYSDSALADIGQWIHYVIVGDTVGIDSLFIYQGNQTVDDTLATTAVKNTRPALQHLFARWNNTEPYDGLVDEIRIWSTARTLAEINANKLKELTGSETGLVYYWKFNNDLTSSATANTLTESWGTASYSTDSPLPQIYYVSNNGNDSNDGLTITTPWLTISKVNGFTFKKSDQVLFHTGDTWREQLTISSSGTSGNVITLSKYDSTGESGADPIISGADLVYTWVDAGGNIYYNLGISTEPLQVFINETRAIFASNSANVSADSAAFWTTLGADTLFIYTTTASDTSNIEASQRNRCILLDNKDYITIESLILEKAQIEGLWLEAGSSHLIINGIIARSNYKFGIHAWDNAAINTNVLIQNSTINNNGASGIDGSEYCQYWTISNNTIYENCLLSDTEDHNYTAGVKFGTDASNSRANIIENNTIYNEGLGNSGDRGAGIWLDTIGDSCFVRYNRIYDCRYDGIRIEIMDTVNIYYNVINGCGTNDWDAGIAITRDCNGNLVYNNDCYDNKTGISVIGDDPAAADNMLNNIIKNNICDGNTNEIFAVRGGSNEGGYGSGNIYTYNCFGIEASTFIHWAGTDYHTYDTWETAYGSGTNSVESDPLFTDATNNDFTLQSSSPCRDAGTSVGLTLDYIGNTVPFGSYPDIGAYELQTSLGSDKMFKQAKMFLMFKTY